jgi:urate oxidase
MGMMHTEISYGKGQVSLYRTYAQPLTGLTPIPESAFTGRDQTLFALEVDVEVFGQNFLPAYTEGDNRNVVATDTMKNFIHTQALAFTGTTLESFLDFLGRQFLATYPQMQALRVTGKEQAFIPARVPEGAGWADSGVLFSSSHSDHATAALDFAREGDAVSVVAHRCGRVGLQLIKVTGSSFSNFLRDAHTTLPDRIDRPLFIYLDVGWRYADVADLLNSDTSRYIAAEQVRDLVQVVFHHFVSNSIQHLLHEIGQRLLERFPQVAEVSFAAQNRLWDTACVSATDEKIKVYTDPRPPYGMITLKMLRDAA